MLRSKRNVKRASHSDGYRCSHYRETITNDERFGNAFTCAELDCDGSTSSSATFTSPSGYNGLALRSCRYPTDRAAPEPTQRTQIVR